MLKTDPNMAEPDAFYEALIEMHSGLDEEQSRIANAKLILLLANHIGDLEIVKEAINLAKAGLAPKS